MKPHYAGANAEITEYCLNDNKKPPVDRAPNYHRYKCLICGEELLTYVHAERHGYESKYEMINKGLAVMIGIPNGNKCKKIKE